MLPIETLRQILLQLSRDDLDAVELVNRHLRSIILSEAFVRWGPLRALDALTVRPGSLYIPMGTREKMYPTSDVLLKDKFVRYVEVDGSNGSIVRWFLEILPRMRVLHLKLCLPAVTRDFQEQLFSVLKCRQLRVTLDDPATTVLPDDIVSLLFSEERNVDDEAPSDVIVGPHDPKTHWGYERSLFMTADYLDGGGVRQLVEALREKAVNATEACPPFYVHIYQATLEAYELPPMRHLNRITGQHFVVDSDGRSHASIKCITVMRPRK